jgi:hypothetical protein
MDRPRCAIEGVLSRADDIRHRIGRSHLCRAQRASMSMNLPWRNPSRIRTGVSGVADQHLTTRSWGHVVDGSSYRGGTWAGGTWGPAGQSPCCRAGGRPGPADRGRRSGRLLLASRGSPPVVGRRNGAGAGFAPASSTLQHRALSNRAATAWCLRPQSGWRGRLPPVARRARPPDRTENLPGFIRALYLLSLTDLVRRIISAPRLICLACRHASTVEISRHESGWRTSGSQGRQDSNVQPPVLETGAQPVELHPSVELSGNEKAAHSRFQEGGVRTAQCELSAPLGLVAVEVRPPDHGERARTQRHKPLWVRDLPQAHGVLLNQG